MSYYPYGVQQYSPIYSVPQYQTIQQPQINTQPVGLNGKVVDSLEVCKVQEIPFGSFGVYPKGDLSEIYIKSWNGDGTTRITVYKPEIIQETSQPDIYMIALEEIKQSIENLEFKIKTPTSSPTRRKKEDIVDE